MKISKTLDILIFFCYNSLNETKEKTMSASLKFNEKLEQLNKFWFEKITKENEEKAKRENEEILKRLGLDRLFQDNLKKNELFKLMNEDFEENKSIFKTAEKTAEIYNKTFDGLDTGNFKPLALKIFDIAKDELKDKAKDTAKDTFEDYFSDKLDDVKKQGFELDKAIQVVQSLTNNNENPLKTLLKNINSDDVEDGGVKEQNKEKEKSKNRMRLRDR